MYLWRRNYPRVKYQPVVCIHGIYYVVKDEIIVKYGKWWEWIYPSSMQPHLRYDPRKLPVIITEKEWTTVSPQQSVPSSSHGASASLLPGVSL